MNDSVSVVILSYNNQDTIERSLESCSQYFKTYVIDSGSTDKTKEICDNHDVVFLYNKFKSFKEQRNFALTLVDTEFTFFLDSDEKITDLLRSFFDNEFLTLAKEEDVNIFEIFRTEYYNKKEVVFGFGRSNYQMRILRTGCVEYHGDVHEYPACKQNKSSFKIRNSLRIEHNPNRDINSIMDRMISYARLGSLKKIKSGRKVGFWLIMLNFNWQLLRLAWIGRRDGPGGFISAYAEAISRTLTYLYVYDHNNKD